MYRTLILIIVFLTSTMVSNDVMAQESKYKFDVGASVGMSGYLGDANTHNPFRHPGIAADLNGRYLANTRMAIRGMLSILTLSGNTADMDNVLPEFASYKFSSSVFDLGVRGEFNFWPYGIGETYKRLSRLTPYLTLGVGVCLSTSEGTTAVAPTLPMGLGVKYKISQRLNFGLEFTMTKIFGDKVDGPVLNDLTGIKTSFVKSTDWASRLTVGLTYEFGERCETCHYVD